MAFLRGTCLGERAARGVAALQAVRARAVADEAAAEDDTTGGA
jgi:hypothetical protein